MEAGCCFLSCYSGIGTFLNFSGTGHALTCTYDPRFSLPLDVVCAAASTAQSLQPRQITASEPVRERTKRRLNPKINCSARRQALFWNRLFGTTGPVEIDFGDESNPAMGQEITHAYGKAGIYTAALRSRGPADEPLEVRMRVVIDP